MPRFGTWIVLVAGVAPDLDQASYFSGAGAFLRLHRAALHSAPGAAVVACATASVFCAIDKRRRKTDPATAAKPALRFLPALFAGLVGVAAHLLLDAASGVGVSFLWPFRSQRCAWDLLSNLDPWILILLLAGLLMPELLRLINEEIGDRKKRARGRTAAIAALALVTCYVGSRAALRGRAVDLLMASEFNKRAPLSADAFPSGILFLDWRGVAVTDSTIEQTEVALGPGAQFDPDRSETKYKPQDSPALEAGEAAALTRMYLRYARLPLASVSQREDGYRVEVHDEQFAEGDTGPDNTFVRVDLDSRLHVVRQEILFAAEPGP